MNSWRSFLIKTVIGIAAILGIACIACLLILAGNNGSSNPSQNQINLKLARDDEAYKRLKFSLVDPNEAPPSIRKLAIIGFKAMLDTKKFAPGHVGNDLSCTHCHFSGGNTTGGSQGGLSLAGVAARYPRFDSSVEKVIDLPGRINNCFLKSMNGKALPLDSDLMLAFVTYFHWISKDLPIYGNIPWLGIHPLISKHRGDAARGKKIYETYCTACHKEYYQGELYAPPLWGKGAFNEGAGLNKPRKLAAFIYWNMPYDDQTPILSEEEALDVASYILSQPRPQYKGPSTSR